MLSMKATLKKMRMKFLLTFKYNIKVVGKGFYMGRGNLINCKHLTIEDDVYIGNNCHISVESLKIGTYTMLASRVSIVGGDHRYDVVGIPIKHTGRSIRKGVVIGKDCWLGHGVTILDGVEIGEGTIVAAGAIVTKSLDPYGIYAGIPAKRIRDRFAAEKDAVAHSKSINKF